VSFVWLEADFVLILKPIRTVTAYTRYTIHIDDEAMPAFDIPLAESYSISFTPENKIRVVRFLICV